LHEIFWEGWKWTCGDFVGDPDQHPDAGIFQKDSLRANYHIILHMVAHLQQAVESCALAVLTLEGMPGVLGQKVMGGTTHGRNELPWERSAISECFLVLECFSFYCLCQETFYDRVSHSGYLENYIRNKRSRDQEITTCWSHKNGVFKFDTFVRHVNSVWAIGILASGVCNFGIPIKPFLLGSQIFVIYL